MQLNILRAQRFEQSTERLKGVVVDVIDGAANQHHLFDALARIQALHDDVLQVLAVGKIQIFIDANQQNFRVGIGFVVQHIAKMIAVTDAPNLGNAACWCVSNRAPKTAAYPAKCLFLHH